MLPTQHYLHTTRQHAPTTPLSHQSTSAFHTASLNSNPNIPTASRRSDSRWWCQRSATGSATSTESYLWTQHSAAPTARGCWIRGSLGSNALIPWAKRAHVQNSEKVYNPGIERPGAGRHVGRCHHLAWWCEWQLYRKRQLHRHTRYAGSVEQRWWCRWVAKFGWFRSLRVCFVA